MQHIRHEQPIGIHRGILVYPIITDLYCFGRTCRCPWCETQQRRYGGYSRRSGGWRIVVDSVGMVLLEEEANTEVSKREFWYRYPRKELTTRRSPSPATFTEADETPKPYALIPASRRNNNNQNPSPSNSSPSPSPPMISGGFVPYLATDENYASQDNSRTGSPALYAGKTSTIQRTPDGKRLVNLLPKNPKGNIQSNGYNREGKTVLGPGRSARHYLAGETPLAGSGRNSPARAISPGLEDQPGSRRGSVIMGGGGSITGSRRNSAFMPLGPPEVGGGGSNRNSGVFGVTSPGGSRRNSGGVALSTQGGEWVKLAQAKRKTSMTGGSTGWAG
jgi:hypothetical protein